MAKLIISPCLYIKDNKISNLAELYELLDFVDKYLDIGLDSIKQSILCEDNWFKIPPYDITMYNFFIIKIIPLLRRLWDKGGVPLDVNIIENCRIQEDYYVTDEYEFKLMLSYIFEQEASYLLGLGTLNNHIKNELICEQLNPVKTIKSVPVVSNVWLDETGNYDDYISKAIAQEDEVFVNKVICSKFKQYVNEKVQGLSSNEKPTIYKYYGKIIAKRNNFIQFNPSDSHKDTIYFRRYDGKYIISVDTMHGTFEVFNSSLKTSKHAEYDFNCKQITQKNKNKHKKQHKI